MSSDDPQATSEQAWLARHHGIISRQEALRLGLTVHQVNGRVMSGTWLQVSRGVYRLAGAPRSFAGDLRAAVLACGSQAVASHLSAAWLWNLVDEPTLATVTIPHATVRGAQGIRIVRSRIRPRVVVRRGIPCTDPVRTILDCAAEASPQELDDLVDRALARRVLRVADLVGAVETPSALRHHRARKKLEARLARRGVTGSPAPSVLESRMARLLAGEGLPAPKAEVVWGPQRRYRLDFAFPSLKLAIEVDGRAYHFTPEQQRWDSRRSNALSVAGWMVLHYNWWDVSFEPDRVAAEIKAAYTALAA